LSIRRTPIARYGARHLQSADCLRGRIRRLHVRVLNAEQLRFVIR
jgi:hypothetical protein